MFLRWILLRTSSNILSLDIGLLLGVVELENLIWESSENTLTILLPNNNKRKVFIQTNQGKHMSLMYLLLSKILLQCELEETWCLSVATDFDLEREERIRVRYYAVVVR